ncbi:hypothetical protein [Bdellovibrio svalbardensis]|uniref:PsiF repeat-containing protein n=1 Tax=Bdellovibrio svalbardensis TaxID=2972972 RepID=A0ABT6DHQ2_9BACT|nr:hypothetical protein [Bdellovibrio svalbardensis]MDG0816002.1 hypothetical protein [Bdellovibrio svalbardensis]
MNNEVRKALVMGLSVAAVMAAGSKVFAQQDSSQHEAKRAAFAECANEVGLPKPEAGQRPQAPDEEQRTKMDACLKAKGFEPPTRFGGGNGDGRHHGPPPEESQNSGIQ